MQGVILDATTLQLPLERAPQLNERHSRLLLAIASEHPGDICDEAKAFLECIFRTIITNSRGEVDEGPRGHATFMSLYGQAWECLNFAGDEYGIAQTVRTVVETIGVTRNSYGGVSHGQDGYDDRALGAKEALYIGREALSIAAYFYAHHITLSQQVVNARIDYLDNPEFNDYLDAEGTIEVAGVTMVPSEILFNNDPVAYRAQLSEFRQSSDDE